MIHESIYDVPPEKEDYGSYFNIKIDDCVTFLYDTKPTKEEDIYGITFNNLLMVEYQIKTLRRFCKSPFNLIVVDNNSGLHENVSREVLDLCVREEIIYIRTPDNYYQNPGTFDPTMKLGTTMNWLYLNCAKKRKPKYFGYLDHDCFLVKDFDVRPYLDEKGMYGYVSRSKINDSWNLHVTPNFYRFDFVEDLVLDFRASHEDQLDTGGKNYKILYKNLNPDDYEIDHKGYFFTEENTVRQGSCQHYETFDNCWYHMLNSSHDQLAGEGQYKIAYTKGYLDARMQAKEEK